MPKYMAVLNLHPGLNSGQKDGDYVLPNRINILDIESTVMLFMTYSS